MREVGNASEPAWGAELTPAPRPRPRAGRAEAEPGGELTELLERVVAIERLLADQSVVLADLRSHVARLTAAGPENEPEAPVKRRRVLSAKT